MRETECAVHERERGLETRGEETGEIRKNGKRGKNELKRQGIMV